jgi:hypothetical protein
MFEICQCNLNRLTKDLVKYTDNRRIGGGLDLEKTMTWFKTNFSNKTNEINWYTSNGYYDGNPLAANGAIVIHIPQAILLTSKQKWIDYYFTVTDDQALADKNGTKEFKYYLDQFIKRYISAGAEYILIPVDGSGQFLPIETLE